MGVVRFKLVTTGLTRFWYHVKEPSHLKAQAYRWDPRIWFILFSNTPPQVKALWAWNLHRPTFPCASFLSNRMGVVRFELVTAGSTRLWYHVKEPSHLKAKAYRWGPIIWFILFSNSTDLTPNQGRSGFSLLTDSSALDLVLA